MPESKYQSGPYKQEIVIERNSVYVSAEVYGMDRRITVRNAEMIIKAVNCHDDLLEALTQLLNRLDHHGNIDIIREEGPIQDAQNAVQKAKGEIKP